MLIFELDTCISLAFPFPFETDGGVSMTATDLVGDLIFLPAIFIPGENGCARGAPLCFSLAMAGEEEGIWEGANVPAEMVVASDTRSSVVARRVFRGVDPEATAATDLEIRSCGALYCKQDTQQMASYKISIHTSMKT